MANVAGEGQRSPTGQAETKDDNRPEQRPGPFAQDRSRTPPTKEQRDEDYKPEKAATGEAAKRAPGKLQNHS
jgi:hypothetical protein